MLLTLSAFVFALGLLVTFHELGHYWVARAAGVRILRFSIGFGPILWRRADRHGTEWALSAIPLGGYVKMLDEPPPGADESTRRSAFEAQPLGRRVAVVAAGPLANLLLAVLLYAFLGLWGSQEPVALLAPPAQHTAAAEAGIRGGETVRAVDGEPVASWSQVQWRLVEALSQGQPFSLTLEEPGGGQRTARIQSQAQALSPDGPDPLQVAGLVLQAPVPVIASLLPDGAARAAGLQPGDRILAAGALQHPSVRALVDTIREHPGQPLALTLIRAGAQVTVTLVPQAETDPAGRPAGRIGAMIQGELPRVLVRMGPLDSLWSGIRRTGEMGAFTLRMMGRMIVGEASWKNISGPVTIAEYAGASARIGLESYLGFLALISISIGVLNLLPIPMLDGGHLLFYLIEALRGGRPVPEKLRDLGLRVGMSLVLGLMVLALFNDFARLFR